MKRRDPALIFFWIVYAVLAAAWVSVWRSGAAGHGLRFAVFTALIALAGVVHSLLPRFQVSRSWGVAYLSLQTALAVILVVLSRAHMLAGALFLPVAGEALGIFPELAWRVAALLGVMLAWTVSVVVTGGWAAVRLLILPSLLALAFVIIYVIIYTRQAQERERAEALLEELEVAHRRLRAYALRVEELTISEERQRMARELHDTLAQGLAGLIMQLEAADQVLARGEPDRAREIVGRALARTRATLADARAVIQALRAEQQPGSLLERIEQVVEQFRTDTGIPCRLESSTPDLEVSAEVTQQVYRAAQEALANVARHARAHQVAVRISRRDDGVELEVIDDGVGFDPADARQRAGHFGLTGLQERAELSGGALEIDSSPGQGCRLRLALPGRLPQGGVGIDRAHPAPDRR